MGRVVTIDGPAGAGKSTVARRLADCLGWRFLDTGALYRAVTLAALRDRIDLESEAALCELVARITVQMPLGRVLLAVGTIDGSLEDVTHLIRSVEVTRASKFIADSPSVRNRLTQWQRQFADATDLVTEGRDQGTLVFPDAFRKYFLTASPGERARRRVADFASRGETVQFETILRDQADRDANDIARAIAPMKPAPDAVTLDTTSMTLDQVVGWMIRDIESLTGNAQ